MKNTLKLMKINIKQYKISKIKTNKIKINLINLVINKSNSMKININ